MKKSSRWFLFTVVILMVSIFAQPFTVFAKVNAQSTLVPSLTPTETPTILTPSQTPTGAPLPSATARPAGSGERPILIVASYSINKDILSVGKPFSLAIKVANQGGEKASNVMLVFDSPKFFPQGNGGVVTIGDLESGSEKEFSQELVPSSELWGQNLAALPVKISYMDSNGLSYTDVFNLTLSMSAGSSSYASSTATPSPRARLVITKYEVDVDPLQPGTTFNLKLSFANLGTGKAQGVTLVLGGAGSAPEENLQSTSVPGGISAGSGDVSNFAPLGSSNMSYIGDVDAGAAVEFSQKLIVNVSTNPGAYAFKVSFVYSDGKNRLVDDQIITLLVYSLPNVDVNFYRDPGLLMLGQANVLPLQVVNMGRKSTILGNITVTSKDGDITNGTGLIGTLDAGGYFTLDAEFLPSHPGSIDLDVTINYTDDFNQPGVIHRNITVKVQDEPTPDPLMNGGHPGENGPEMMNENGGGGPGGLGQVVLRLMKGLIGLDSGAPLNNEMEGGSPGGPAESVPAGGMG